MRITQSLLLLIASFVVARMCLGMFLNIPMGYRELSLSATLVLIIYIAFLVLACCRNAAVHLVAMSALVYVMSTCFRAVFPVMQEFKTCYHVNAFPPWVDRVVALLGELALGVQIAFVVATMAHLARMAYAKCIFFTLIGVITLAELVCNYACLTHPIFHNIEYILWGIIVFLVLMTVLICMQHIHTKQMRKFSVVVLMTCLFVMYFFVFELKYYDEHMIPNTNMLSCQSGSREDWSNFFKGYAYPYFVVFASISTCMTLAVQTIRNFDNKATEWLLARPSN